MFLPIVSRAAAVVEGQYGHPVNGRPAGKLKIKGYTNFDPSERAKYDRFWSTSADLYDAPSRQLYRGTADAPVERSAPPPLTRTDTRPDEQQ
jgi:hypothetical protein